MWECEEATTIEQAREEVVTLAAFGSGDPLLAYAYMRRLYEKDINLYYATLMAHPAELLPIVYTPTVGEARLLRVRFSRQRQSKASAGGSASCALLFNVEFCVP
eukprot:2428384-Amphidinium_carterae.1